MQGQNTKKGKHKRSKAMTILFLPIGIFIFIAGWFMYIIGDKKRKGTIQVKPSKEDNITLLPIVPEEEQNIRNSS